MSSYTKDLNLLILEDDYVAMTMLRRVFAGDFKNIYSTDNGNDGLEIIDNKDIHVVISDINIFGLNGIDVLEEVRRRGLDIPFILISAEDKIDVFKRAISLGASCFANKPLNIKKLRNSVEIATAKYQIRELQRKNQEQQIELLKHREKYNKHHMKNAFKKEMNILKDDLGRRFIKKKLPDGTISIQCFNTFYKPREILSGDCFSTRKISENKSLCFIIDTMGKGLTASVTAIISTSFINHAIDKAIMGVKYKYSFEKILESYIDYIKKMVLDDEIVAASFFEIDADSQQITYAHFGMPYMLFYDVNGKLTEINSNNPPISKYLNSFEISHKKIENICRIITFSDGIVEIEANKGESAMDLLNKTVKDYFFFNPFQEHYGNSMGDFDDDVTLIQYKHYKLKPSAIKDFKIKPTLKNIMKMTKVCESLINEITLNEDIRNRMVLIFNELIMNAYEHGSIGIKHEEKHELIENDTYHEALIKMEKECKKHIYITFASLYYCKKYFILTVIKDEGEGFNLNITDRAIENQFDYFNGRGVIISKLQADELYYNLKGNEVMYFMEYDGGSEWKSDNQMKTQLN